MIEMNRIIPIRTISLLFVWALFACAGARAQEFEINGTLEGLADGTTLELIPLSHTKGTAIAQTTLESGRFTLKGNVTEPLCVRLMIKDNYGSIELMLDKGSRITLTSKAQKNDTPNGSYYTFSGTQITGSPLTDRYKALMSVKDSFNLIRDDFEKRYDDIQEAYGAAYKAQDRAKMDSIKATDRYKAMLDEDNAFFHAVDAAFNRVILDNKESYWGPLLMISLTGYLTPDQRPNYEAFSQAAKESTYGKMVKEELYPAGQVGQKVAPFTVKDEAGKEYTLASLLKGKRYLLIDFWASWCGPCRKEIPNVKKQYALYKDKGFQVVSISIDKDAAAWKKAVTEEKLEWPNFLSPEVADQYKVSAVPTMYLVDSEGKIVAESGDARGEKLAAKLAELFQ